jgi:hypothetical protein
MPNQFSSGKFAIAECDRCAFRFKLNVLRKLVIKTQIKPIKVCPECWEPDQPQLQLGMYPVNDPQAVREPRKDLSYWQSGYNGLQTSLVSNNDPDSLGYTDGGSRQIQWGWNPVGGSQSFTAEETPNYLVMAAQVGTVTVTTT